MSEASEADHRLSSDPQNLTDVRPREEALSRTWEMELLISGGVIFALFQLSAALEAGFDRLLPHLTTGWLMAVFLFYPYLKMMVYTLIVSFILHLAARAYWIGLIGLDSVFPGGVRWDRVKTGPIFTRVHRDEMPSLRHLIVKANNLCSTIFSFAFLIVLLFAVSIVGLLPVALLSYGISQLFDHELALPYTLMGISFLFLLVFYSLLGIDKAYGSKLEPEGRTARTLYKFFRGWSRLLMERAYRPMALVLSSNFQSRVGRTLLSLGFVLLFAIFMVKDVWLKYNDVSLSRFLPREQDEHSLPAEHYESQWPEGEMVFRSPSIQADIIEDPYLKLFIPHLPLRADQAVEKRCPQASAEAPERVLACLAGIYRVSLDGKPLPLRFRFHTHPRSGVRGILAYVPVAGLAQGEHVLRVARTPRRQEPNPEPYVIRFWI